MKLLVVRPQPGAGATAKRIEALGHDALLIPLFHIEPVTWVVPANGDYDALILSSGNAVRHAGRGLHELSGLPIYAVGSATTQAADNAGLRTAFTGQSNVDALIAAARDRGNRRLLWLAGEDRIAVAVPDDVSIDTRSVYKSATLPAPAGFSAAVSDAEAVLLHSPRAATYFSTLCDDLSFDRSVITLATLSRAIAESAGSGWQQVVVAAEPNDAALLSEVQRCFTNDNCDP